MAVVLKKEIKIKKEDEMTVIKKLLRHEIEAEFAERLEEIVRTYLESRRR